TLAPSCVRRPWYVKPLPCAACAANCGAAGASANTSGAAEPASISASPTPTCAQRTYRPRLIALPPARLPLLRPRSPHATPSAALPASTSHRRPLLTAFCLLPPALRPLTSDF